MIIASADNLKGHARLIMNDTQEHGRSGDKNITQGPQIAH